MGQTLKSQKKEINNMAASWFEAKCTALNIHHSWSYLYLLSKDIEAEINIQHLQSKKEDTLEKQVENPCPQQKTIWLS